MSDKAIYEIVNPSDAYTLECERFDVACAACLLIGEGKYALNEIGGEGREMPFMMFDPDLKWWKTTFNNDVADFVKTNRPAIAACLDTVMIGDAGIRELYNTALELIVDEVKKKEYRDRWHEKQRSSTNDIGAYAWKIAERLRENEKSERITK